MESPPVRLPHRARERPSRGRQAAGEGASDRYGMIRPDRRRTLVPRRRIPVHLAPAVFVLAGLLGLVAGTVRGQEAAPVVVLPTSGVVDQIMAGYIRDGIAKAEADGAQAVIIQLDTPVGSLDATREIVQAELDASIPVIVWV